MHSATTQANLEHHPFADAADVYTTQWIQPNDHGHPRDLANGPSQMTPEDLLLATQLQASREFAMDAPVNTSMQSVTYHHSQSMSRQSISADSFAGNTSFADDSQMMEPDGNEDGDSFHGLQPATKSASRSSANNEMEMRMLFHSSKHRSLREVAQELHGNERGPNSERTRQVFAMLWYA